MYKPLTNYINQLEDNQTVSKQTNGSNDQTFTPNKITSTISIL